MFLILLLDSTELTLARLVTCLLQTLVLLCLLGLLARDNATILVVLQVTLRQTTRRMLGSAMHDLRTRTHRRDMTTSCLLHLPCR